MWLPSINKTFECFNAYNYMEKQKKARIKKAHKATLPPANDGTNSPVPDHDGLDLSSKEEAALFKQAENPLGVSVFRLGK